MNNTNKSLFMFHFLLLLPRMLISKSYLLKNREELIGIMGSIGVQKSQGNISPSFFLHKEFFVTLKGHPM